LGERLGGEGLEVVVGGRNLLGSSRSQRLKDWCKVWALKTQCYRRRRRESRKEQEEEEEEERGEAGGRSGCRVLPEHSAERH
jgi:hypothetical protein